MTAARLAEIIRLSVSGHPLIRDIQHVPGGPRDRAGLAIADYEAMLWTVAVYPWEAR